MMNLPFRTMVHRRSGLLLLLMVFIAAVLLLELQVQDLHNERDKQIREDIGNKHARRLQKDGTASLLVDDFRQAPGPVVIYNRVPKTGSTSFTGLAYSLCEQNRFNVLHVGTVGNSHVLSVQDQMTIVRNMSSWTTKHPAFFHGHFAYIDFPSFGSTLNPLYVNMVRSPLERFVSYYYFLRHGDDLRPSLSRHRSRNNETLDECVLKKGYYCAPDRMWIQVPFFCGHNPECWKPGSKWALEQAKFNLVNHYFLVGVTEHMEEFVAIVEAALPNMFKGALELFQSGEKSHLRRTLQKMEPSPYTLDTLRNSEVWRIEDKFYRFALETFRTSATRSLSRLSNNKIEFVGTQFSYHKVHPRPKHS
ncbi:heparan sulfate 2-O-sulfotransferase 1-like [Diadema setosum]|uniref:heparan sulfate 2-O-sulfotransferase 1-like n=1 Tax=Diadema setosum TaxID=31175 RepID=UPI003B3BE9CA